MRRRLLSTSTNSGPWKQTKAAAPSTMRTANLVKSWIDTIQPTAAHIVLVRDAQDSMSGGNGTLLCCLVERGSGTGGYMRYYNGSINGGTGWTKIYDLAVDAGDMYTVLYQ